MQALTRRRGVGGTRRARWPRPLRWGLVLACALLVVPAAPAAAAIPSGNQLKLDGSDDYATVADNTSLDIGDEDGEDFTVETFFYVDNTTRTENENDILFSKGPAPRGNIVFRSSTTDTIVFRLTSTLTLSNNTNISDGWHHVAFVYDNEFSGDSDRFAIYYDGAEFAVSTAIDFTPGFPNNANAFDVGALTPGLGAWDDWMDEFRVSDTVRYTSAYTVPTSPFSTDGNTRALWHFDDAACTATFADSSTNANDLTGQNGAITGVQGAPAPTLQFSSATYTADENAGTAVISVTRTGDPIPVVGVNRTTTDGTATAGVDYTDSDGPLNFACGDLEETFSVPIIADATPEADETVDLALDTPIGGASLGSPSLATLTIIDVDVTPPTSFVSFPTDGSSYTSATYASGCLDSTPDVCIEAADDGGPFTFSVEVRIRRASDGRYWNNSGWQDDETWLLAGSADGNFWTFGFVPDEDTYTVTSRATDDDANVETALSDTVTFTVDDTPPGTTIDSGPSGPTNDATPTFTFSSDDPGAVFQCRVDTAAFGGCSGPGQAHTTAVLADGLHTFRVRAIDPVGNADATPASRSFTVDTLAPETTIDSGPAAASTSGRSVTFTFSSNETGSTFQCKLDAGVFALCGGTTSGSKSYSSLSNGTHTFQVRARDPAGNLDPTPSSRTWNVDAIAPTVTLTTPTTLTGPVQAVFSELVRGVTAANFVLRVRDTTANLAGTIVCRDAGGAIVSCGTGNVKRASLTPRLPLVPGQRYTTIVNPSGATPIRDLYANVGVTTSKNFRAATSVEENSPAVIQSWRRVVNAGAFGGSYVTNSLGGAKASFAFTGTGVTIYVVRGPDQGLGDVSIDGTFQATMNNYATTMQLKVARSFATADGAHVITINVRGLKGSPSGTGTYFSIDAFKVGATTYNTPNAVYAWPSAAAAGASGGRHARSRLGGTAAAMTFRGVGVSWYGMRGPDQGKANLLVDGAVVATVDTYASTSSLGLLRHVTGLTDAVHTVRIEVRGDKRAASTNTWVSLDRLTVD